MRIAAVAALVLSAALARGEEAHNVRLVGFHDLAARSAYQPTIKNQGERWIAYIGSHGGRSVNPLNGRLEEGGTSVPDGTDPRAPPLLPHHPREPGPGGP